MVVAPYGIDQEAEPSSEHAIWPDVVMDFTIVFSEYNGDQYTLAVP